MLRRLYPAGVLIAAACGRGPVITPATTTPADTGGRPAALPTSTATAAIHLAPGTARYVVHYRKRVEQEIAGHQPTTMSYRAYISASIRRYGDPGAHEVTHVVDSIVADSGSFVPPTVNFAAARGLRLSARLTPSGVVHDEQPADSVQGRQFAQFLSPLRDFYPRLPAEGLRATSMWTDTVTSAERSGDSEVVKQAVMQRVASGWEDRDGGRSVRIDAEGSYTVLGSGEQTGQPFEVVGSGTRRAVDFVSLDGRYLGGETRDSASLSITLPAQGMTIPIRQILHATVAVLP